MFIQAITMKISSKVAHKAVRELSLPHYITLIRAGATGFPSPAEDFMQDTLDLNEHLIKHPAATFYCRVSGDSMKDIGIMDGDILVVDRSVKHRHGQVVLAALNGELTCKVLDLRNRRLLSANDSHPPIPIGEDAELIIEGVVTTSITQHYVCTC
jgi:DNA polymerase V